ncbi:Putative AC transposase [Linum perenne]
MDELSFKSVDKEGFRRFMKKCCPMFRIPGRRAIRDDCARLFLERKDSLKTLFSTKGMGRISVTTDCWTNLRNQNFICVTAHFIGRNWQLHKKIIAFRQITSHKGEDVAGSVMEVLAEWDIRSVVCCTVDKASANDVAIRHMREHLELWGGNIISGRYLHMRCVAHIINLIVQDGLEEIGISIRRVREACKWIIASPSRTQTFRRAADNMLLTCKHELSLDMPTRWNATYIMLEHAEPYEAAFRVYEGMLPGFVADLNKLSHGGVTVGPPGPADWIKVRWMMEYLKKFYDLTCLVSGTSYVTSHLFFKEMCDLFNFIDDIGENADDEIRSMAARMKLKVAKYWSEEFEENARMNKFLYIAAILDPRQKMKHVEKCLKHIYGQLRASQLTGVLRTLLSEMVDVYKGLQKRQKVTNDQKRRAGRGSLSSIRSDSDDEDDHSEISELSLYLSEGTFKERKSTVGEDGSEMDIVDKFDVLKWWSSYGIAYPILSEMAKDMFGIPISTVASESAFSLGGRIMDEFRTSLHPTMLEALVCASDWLRDGESVVMDEEDVPIEEQEKEYQRGKLIIS